MTVKKQSSRQNKVVDRKNWLWSHRSKNNCEPFAKEEKQYKFSENWAKTTDGILVEIAAQEC